MISPMLGAIPLIKPPQPLPAQAQGGRARQGWVAFHGHHFEPAGNVWAAENHLRFPNK